MKKILSLLLAAAMLLALLAGCGSSSDTSESASEAEETETAEEAETEEAEEASETADGEWEMETVSLPITEDPVTVTFWTSLDPRIVDFLPTENVEEALLVYGEIAEQTGISIHLDAVSVFTQTELFQLMVVSGDYDDIIYNVDGLYTTGYSGAIEDGVIMDVSALLEEYAPNVYNTIMNSEELSMSLVDETGQIGVIPMVYKEGGLETADIVYRLDWAEEFGIGQIESVEDYHEYLQMAKEVYGATGYTVGVNTGGISQGSVLDDYMCQAMGAYGSFYQIDGEVIYGGVEDSYYDYLQEMLVWWSEGLYPEDAMTIDMSQQQQNFGVGTQASTLCNGSPGITELYAYAPNDDGSNSIEVWALGKITYEGENQWLVSTENSIQKDATWSLSTDCTEPELIAQLANWLYTDEGSMVVCYGIEGVTYTLDENGEPQWTDMILNNENGYSTTVTINMYATASVPCVFDQRRTFFDFDETQEALVEVFKGEDVNRNNIPSGADSLWTTDEQTEYADVSADISTYREEMEWKFITGNAELTEESWQEYVDTMYNMGLQTLIDLYQTAYDRYEARLEELEK